MNSVSHPWIALRASCALVALLLAAPGCPGEGGGTDTDDTTTTGTPGTTSDGTDGSATEPTSTEPTTGGSGGMLSHAADIQPIWDANCVTGCHEPNGTGSPWFLLTPDEAYGAIVNKPSLTYPTLTLVTPGDPDASYLLNKLLDTQSDVGGGTSPMPMPADPSMFMKLPQADIDKITTWIEQGAMP